MPSLRCAEERRLRRESSAPFPRFLQVFPGGQYAPNALYWLERELLRHQNYALAGQQFQSLLTVFPTHDKAPGALLKLGLAQYGLKQYPQADATPAPRSCSAIRNSDIAHITADDRLRAMQVAGNR